MNSPLGFLCVLFALVATGHSLNCTQCISSSGTSCTGSQISCANANDLCSSSLSVTTATSGTSRTFTRTCSPTNQCDTTGSLTFLYGNVKVGTSCCSANNCTPAIPTLPGDYTQVNSLTCRTCYVGNNNYCYTGETIQCKGNETLCLRMSSVLSATGHSLNCTECINTNGISCTGKQVSCANANDVCSSSHTVTTTATFTYHTFSQTCTPRNQCNITGSLYFLYGIVKVGTSCCDTDNCSPAWPTIPAESTQLNGVTCGTCTADNAEWCDTGETMKCAGDENRCILQITTMSGSLQSKQVLRGCATQSICNIANESVITSGISVDVQISCTNGSLAVVCSIFIQSFVALLLITSLCDDKY
ncbi:uncharacterized protein RCH25_008148 [Pelodytes ibericus]